MFTSDLTTCSELGAPMSFRIWKEACNFLCLCLAKRCYSSSKISLPRRILESAKVHQPQAIQFLVHFLRVTQNLTLGNNDMFDRGKLEDKNIATESTVGTTKWNLLQELVPWQE